MGLASRALEEATRYSMERKTFGKPIFEVIYFIQVKAVNLDIYNMSIKLLII